MSGWALAFAWWSLFWGAAAAGCLVVAFVLFGLPITDGKAPRGVTRLVFWEFGLVVFDLYRTRPLVEHMQQSGFRLYGTSRFMCGISFPRWARRFWRWFTEPLIRPLS